MDFIRTIISCRVILWLSFKKTACLYCVYLFSYLCLNLPYFFAKNHKIQNTCWKQWPIVNRCYNIWARKLLFPVWNRLDIRSWKFHGETITTSWDISGGGGGGIRSPPPGPYQHQNNPVQIGLRTVLKAVSFCHIGCIFYFSKNCIYIF